jgi:Zn-dependent protease with chaperone function
LYRTVGPDFWHAVALQQSFAMRWGIATLVLLLAGPAAHADDENILGVLARSQLARLDRARVVDNASPRARTVRGSFENLARVLGLRYLVELRVIEGDTVAETLQGRIVLANESLADLAEGERLFILAHELGHVELRHWEQTERLYRKWVPGVVTPDQTEPVAALLGRDAAGLAYQQELEADAFALRALHALNRPMQDAVSAFMHMGASHDTATHPGTGKRLAALRAAEAAWSRGAQALGQPETRNEPIDSVKRVD